MRRAMGWSRQEVAHLDDAPVLHNRPSPQAFTKEVTLTATFTLMTAGAALLNLPLVMFPVGSTVHTFGGYAVGLLTTWGSVGLFLHMGRYLWAKHVYNKEMREYRKGRTDFSDEKGSREYSRDIDFVYQLIAAVPIALYFEWIFATMGP
jgi:hypothetical protein